MNRYSPVTSRVLGWHAEREHAAIARSDRLLTHTRHHRDVISAEERIAAERFLIVPHGLPDPGEPPPYAATDADGNIEFLYVGRFEPRKGFDVLLAAIPRVIEACPNVTFTLAGASGDAAWADFTREYPHLAGRRATYLGPVTQNRLNDLYRRCAVLVAPSRYESFGLIYPEAMSRAKPVIGCVAGGIPEVVDDGVTGLLAQPGDVTTLVDCIVKLSKDPDLRRRMGDAGRRDFLRRFSATELARQSVAAYRSAEPNAGGAA